MGGLCTRVKNPQAKSELLSRWPILVLSSSLMIGSYYCYDNPSALHDPLRAYMDMTSAADKDKYETWFNLLYTVYSVPNVVLPFLGGYIVDWLGARRMNVLFTCFIATGQLVFAFGAHIKSFPVMLVGRTIFGFGGESLSVGCSTIVAEWFKGRELAFALGINLAVARLGSVINDAVSPKLAHATDVPITLYFGTIICAFSVLCAFIIIPIDKSADKRIKAERDAAGEEEEEKEEIHLSDAKTFQLSFWLLTVACVVVYGCVLPFNNIASALIIEKFICLGACCGNNVKTCPAQKSAEATAGYAMGIPYIISAVSSPFLGGLVDRVGGRAILAMVSSLILVGVHLGIAFTDTMTDLYPALVFQGVAYSVFAAALWPSVPYVVKAHQVGTAYGVMTALQNGGLATFPLLVAAVYEHYNSYKQVELLFVGLAGLGVLCGAWLNYTDCKNDHTLNRPHFKELAEDVTDMDYTALLDPKSGDKKFALDADGQRRRSLDVESYGAVSTTTPMLTKLTVDAGS